MVSHPAPGDDMGVKLSADVPKKSRTLVVGAGMAGLACGARLQAAGWSVVVLDKGRRPGGRVATRDTAAGCFDHGAQFFTCRTAEFAAAVKSTGTAAATWRIAGRDAPVWTGQPTLQSFAQSLSRGLDVRCGQQVAEVERQGDGWLVRGHAAADRLPFTLAADHLVLTLPLPQLAALCPWQVWPDPDYAPNWTVMLTLPEALSPAAASAVSADHPVLGSLLAEHLRPGRGGPPRITVQANAAWSRRHLEHDPADVAAQLQQAAAAHLHCAADELPVVSTHRWLYALCARPAPGPWWDPAQRLGAAGDGWSAPRVESAWCSGHELAGLMLAAG